MIGLKTSLRMHQKKVKKLYYLGLGDFNKNLFEDDLDREWQNLTMFGSYSMILQLTQVTPNSKTLIDHIYTSTEENISC